MSSVQNPCWLMMIGDYTVILNPKSAQCLGEKDNSRTGNPPKKFNQYTGMIEGFKAFLTKSKFPPETHAKATPRRAASPATSLDHICELETGAERRLKPVETC